MKYDKDEFKKTFIEQVEYLSSNYSESVLLEKLMGDYKTRLGETLTDRVESELKKFSKILATSKKIKHIRKTGLYCFVYSLPNNDFTFIDTFPVMYIFNPKDFVNNTVAGINLNRLGTTTTLKYVEKQIQEKNPKVKQAMEYELLNRFGANNTPFRRYKMKGIVMAWEIIPQSLQYFNLSWMTKTVA